MLSLIEAQEAYLNNADYFAEQSVEKCKAFLTACNQLLVLLPAQASTGTAGHSTTWSIEAIAQRLASAQSWLSTRLDSAARSRTRFATFEDFRE